MPKPKKYIESRNAILTMNNPEDWKKTLEDLWKTGDYDYINGQLEKAPTTGTVHL